MGEFACQRGGLNRYFANLIAAQQSIGVQASGVVFAERSHSVTSAANIKVLPQQPLVLRWWSLSQQCRVSGSDVDVIDSHFALHGIAALPLQRRVSLPLVVHFQGPLALEAASAGQRGLKPILKKFIERAVYARADAFVVLSAAFADVLTSYHVDQRLIRVVPPGVRTDVFAPGDSRSARAAIGMSMETPIVFAARRLTRRMGLDLLIRAHAVLRNKSTVLCVAGSGPDMPALLALAISLGTSDRVRFFGDVSDQMLVSLYQAADCAVVPSRAHEGFGLVVLEAFACGTPVVATRVGGLTETLSAIDPTLLVQPDCVGSLSRRLDAALDGDVPSRMDCVNFAEKFSWQRVAREHSRVYEALL